MLKINLIFLHGCDTLCVALNEEHRLRVLEKGMPRRIFGPKKDEVAEGWMVAASKLELQKRQLH
jgi:hypothetical protein